MVRTLRARWVLAAAALLVCAFLVGFTEDFIHTDDGCEVETHCLACQRLLVSVGVGTVAPVWRPSVDVVAVSYTHLTLPTTPYV